MPTPMLRVSSMSSSPMRPTDRTSSKTGPGRHVARSTVTSIPSGTTRTRLFARPPPVMWLIACTVTVRSSVMTSPA